MSEDLVPDPEESPPATLAPVGLQPEEPVPQEGWKKGGRLLSGLLAVNVMMLACTIISGGAFNKVAVYDTDVFTILTTMMLVALLWIIFYLTGITRCREAVPYRDEHAGPIWLRGGLVVFGICSLVMDVFKIGYYSSFLGCQSVIKILHPVTQAVFVIIQTYFLWVSAKDCIQMHLDLTRCGLMFTLSTNMAIWMAAVIDESVHQAHSYGGSETNSSRVHFTPDPNRSGSEVKEPCLCETVVCNIFQQGYFYLYPFNIEYSLFASTMLYVMWKNVGRLFGSTHSHKRMPSRVGLFRETYFVGPVLGLLLFVMGLAVFIIYEVQVDEQGGHNYEALVTYYSYNITVLVLMILASVGGWIIYRFDRRAMDKHKNPTRTLDVALLMGAALGQYAISYYSIVAVVASMSQNLLEALSLALSLLMIIQHTFQNVFIVESLHRAPNETVVKEPCHGLAFANLDALHSLPAGSPTPRLANPNPENPQETVSIITVVKEPCQGLTCASMDALHSLPAGSPTPRLANPSPENPQEAVSIVSASGRQWQRRCLKDISLFLVLCNVILWVILAFGARPHFSNTTEVNFYGYSLWAAIVNVCLPFSIFYRMHAVSSLLEVYVHS